MASPRRTDPESTPDPTVPSPTHHILVIGASGYLGQHVMHQLLSTAATHLPADSDTHLLVTPTCGSTPTYGAALPTDHQPVTLAPEQPLNLTSAADYDRVFTSAPVPPAVVINCAALSSLGRCETARDEALLVNAPTLLLTACSTHCPEALLVQLSTDIVYGEGTDEGATEDTPPAPLNVYGESKAKFEADVAAASSPLYSLIIRSSNMLGGRAPIRHDAKTKKFLEWLLGCITSETPINAFNDEYRSYVAVGDVVDTVLKASLDFIITKTPPPKLLTVGGPEALNRVDIAESVAKAVAEHDPSFPPALITGIPRSEAGIPYSAPLNLKLNSSAAAAYLSRPLTNVRTDVIPHAIKSLLLNAATKK